MALKAKIVSFAAALLLRCFCCSVHAFEVPESFLKLVAESRVEFSYSFIATQGKKVFSGKGSVTYQDKAYKMENELYKVYNDCTVMCSVNEADREIVVEPGVSVDYLSHPEYLLDFFGKKAKGADITPHFSSGGRLTGVDAELKDGSTFSLRIPEMEFGPKGDLSDFSFDLSAVDNSYVVTDLR